MEILPVIETIYFSARYAEIYEEYHNRTHFISLLDQLKQHANGDDEILVQLESGNYIQVMPGSVMKYYPYQFNYMENNRVKMRFFYKRGNRFSPDAYCMISSEYLWTEPLLKLHEECKRILKEIPLALINLTENYLARCKKYLYDFHNVTEITLSRFDYAHHTRLIPDIEEYIPYNDSNRRTRTRLKLGNRKPSKDGAWDVSTETLYFGTRGSNLIVRIYDKITEVFAMGYKNWFFKIWYDNNLITDEEYYLLEEAYATGMKEYKTAVRVALLKQIESDFEFIKDKHITEEMVKFNRYIRQGKQVIDLFSRLNKYILKTYKKDYESKIPVIVNFEFEVKRNMFESLSKFELPKGFEELGEEPKREFLKTAQLKEYKKDVFELEQFAKYADSIRKHIMKNVFVVINPDNNEKKRCSTDQVYKKLQESELRIDMLQEQFAFIKNKTDNDRLEKTTKQVLSSTIELAIQLGLPIPDEVTSNEDIEQICEMAKASMSILNTQTSENKMQWVDRMVYHKTKKYKSPEVDNYDKYQKLKKILDGQKKENPEIE